MKHIFSPVIARLKMRSLQKEVIKFRCEKSLKLYTRVYSFMPRFIIKWNGFSLTNHKLCSIKCLGFLLNFVLILGLLNAVSVIHVFRITDQDKTGSLKRSTVQIAGTAVLAFFGLLALNKCLSSFVVKCQQMKLLYMKLDLYKDKFDTHDSQLWKNISKFLNWAIIVGIIYPVVLTLARATAPKGNRDPMCKWLYHLFSYFECALCNKPACTKIANILLKALQFLLTFIRTAETFRILIVLFLVILYFIEMQIKTLGSIQLIFDRTGNYALAYKIFSAWRLAQQGNQFQNVLAILMTVGFFAFTTSNINIVKWIRGGSSWKTNIQYPISSFMAGFNSIVWLDTMASVSVNSSKLIRKIQLKSHLIEHKSFGFCVGGSYRKFVYRQWKSAQHVSYSCGSTFNLSKGIDIMYMHLVMMRTIEGILLSTSG